MRAGSAGSTSQGLAVAPAAPASGALGGLSSLDEQASTAEPSSMANPRS
jgi:hypothetical protein